MKEAIAIEKLQDQQLNVLRAIKKEGEKHLKYFYSTMKHFKFPEKRMKCFDTTYYEEALPVIERVLRERGKKI